MGEYLFGNFRLEHLHARLSEKSLCLKLFLEFLRNGERNDRKQEDH